jgi:hypothetical protein
MWNGICGECGSSEVYIKRAGVWGGGAGPVVLVRGGLFKNAVTLETALCAQCGSVAFRVPSAQRKDLREIVQEKGWTPLRGTNHG